MSDSRSPAGDGRPPRAGEVLALLVIVPAVGAAARVFAAGTLTTPRWSALLVGVCAGTVGLPALAWLFERGRTGLDAFAGAGVAAGALPPVLLAISGAVGLALLGGGEYAWWALGHGPSIPLYGTLAWSKFLGLLAWSVSVGLASGLIFGLLVAPVGRWRHPANWLWAIVALAFSVAAGAVFG
jgi:hypothetical protein